MKRLLSILVCTALLLALPAQALAAQGDLLVTRETEGILSDREGIYVQCAVGDALYMLLSDSKSLLVQRAGESAPIRYSVNLDADTDINHSISPYLFSDGERPLMLVLETDSSRDQYVQTAKVYAVSLADMQANLELVCEPDWEPMREESGDYYKYLDGYLGVKGGLMIRSYDNRGDSVILFLNCEDGSITTLDLPNVIAMTAYTEGRVLLEIFDYDQPEQAAFQIYNPADGSVENLLTFKVENYDYYQGLACDAETGDVYCIKGGEIFQVNLTDGTLGEAIANMPLEMYSDTAGYVLSGGYYACASYQGYVLRNLHPEQRAEKRLVILDGSYMNCVSSAYYDFINAHGDMNVILSHDFSSSALIDSMMNRDSSVDVYILSGASSDFEAVYNRGYIAEFGDGEAVSDLANHLNAGLRDKLSINGAFCVLPVEGYFWLPRINTVALGKLGLTIEDVPTNWSDFLDFLLDLQAKMPQDRSVTLMDLYTSQTYARMELFNQIFESYQTLLTQDAQAVDSRQMTEILKKLEQLDFAAFGQPTEEETASEDYNPTYNEDGVLLSTNSGTRLEGIIRDNEQPLVMSLTADTPAYLPMDGSVAFINPFSENLAEAQAFIETLCVKLDDSIRYCLRDDLNEPTLNPYHDEIVQSMEEYVASVQKALDEAEAADKQDLEQQLKDAQESLERTRQDVWAITEQDIAWLRAHSDNLVLKGSNWLYKDDSGEVYDLVQQYSEGMIDAERLMKAVDNKIRMMIMEGN